jgi:hypothetical protein
VGNTSVVAGSGENWELEDLSGVEKWKGNEEQFLSGYAVDTGRTRLGGFEIVVGPKGSIWRITFGGDNN